ncbi:MAG TPA: MBL fold metallo-hydrolase [Mycobacteriales bacterium]|nr:MBL fold metallo-hydrolase [Mycobacteriales bacterium]
MDTYTGVVTAGSPASRPAGALVITKASVGPMDNNAYLLTAESGERLLIDAANDAASLLALLEGAPLQTVLTTHQHRDHWQALAEVVRRTGARTVAHPLDAPALPVPTDRPVEDGDTVTVGPIVLTIIHLRGHTPGGIAVRYDEPGGRTHLFTGDSLFPGGVGKTAGSAEFRSLMDDVQQRVFDVLPDDTWVYPGHGNDTTLGAERPHLTEWRERGW